MVGVQDGESSRLMPLLKRTETVLYVDVCETVWVDEDWR
jgi:hypothetical protein